MPIPLEDIIAMGLISTSPLIIYYAASTPRIRKEISEMLKEDVREFIEQNKEKFDKMINKAKEKLDLEKLREVF